MEKTEDAAEDRIHGITDRNGNSLTGLGFGPVSSFSSHKKTPMTRCLSEDSLELDSESSKSKMKAQLNLKKPGYSSAKGKSKSQ